MRHETFQHVRLPEAIWCSVETQTALRDRRVGHLFLLAKKYAGASQARIAAATGLNQSEVSRIQRGDRLVTAIDVLERVADGFAMPDPARMLLGLAPVAWPDAEAPGHPANPAAVAAPTNPTAPPERLVTPAQLPPAIRGFVGRSAELAWLHGHPDAGTLVVVGPAGIGKTALALTWAHAAAPGFPDGQLYVNLNGSGADPVDPSAAVAGFIRALDTVDTAVPPTPEERTARYRSLLAGKRLLILIDDASTAEQVRPLLPGNRHCLVLLTSRGHLDDLLVREGATAHQLGPLPGDEARDLVARIVGHSRVDAAPDAVDELAETCGRVPLALRTAAVRLARSPALSLNAPPDIAQPSPTAGSPTGAVVRVHANPAPVVAAPVVPAPVVPAPVVAAPVVAAPVVAVIRPRPIPNPAARRALGWSAVVAVCTFAALAIAVIAGGPAVAQIIDRTSRHAAMASRGGQLALLRLLVLAGCGILLVAIARGAREHPVLLACCLAGVQGAALLATPGVSANSLGGPPSLVNVVQLVAASVWVSTIAVMAVTVLPAVHRHARTGRGVRRATLTLALLASVAGTWLSARQLADAPSTSTVVFRHLITAEGALLIAALGIAAIRWLTAGGPPTRQSFTASIDPTNRRHGQPMVRALVLAVAALLAVSGMVATIPTHPSGRSASQPAPARSPRGA